MKRNRALHLSLDFVARSPGGNAAGKVRRVCGEASAVCSITMRYFIRGGQHTTFTSEADLCELLG